jgi:cytochrome c556
MKRFLLMTTCFAALGVTMAAQDDAEYQTWMKTAGATSGSLRKNLEAKNAEAASADAKKLQEVFGHVHEYWSGKHVDDAMKFAMDASTGFGQVAEQAGAGKFDEAAAILKTTSATCGGCHAAHREDAGRFFENQIAERG